MGASVGENQEVGQLGAGFVRGRYARKRHISGGLGCGTRVPQG